MNDQKIFDLAAELNAETLKSNCVVKFVQHGGGPDASHIVATRAGYLKLASLFLHAAVAPHKDESLIVDIDVEDIFHEDSNVFIAWLKRDEKLQLTTNIYDPEPRSRWMDKLWAVGCAIIALVIMTLIVVGFATVVSLLFK